MIVYDCLELDFAEDQNKYCSLRENAQISSRCAAVLNSPHAGSIDMGARCLGSLYVSVSLICVLPMQELGITLDYGFIVKLD